MKIFGKRDESKTPAEWCKTGNTPVNALSLLAYAGVIKLNEEKKRFPKEYADRVREIVSKGDYYSTPEELRSGRPLVIHADARGFCPFYDEQRNKCMLGDSRPKGSCR